MAEQEAPADAPEATGDAAGDPGIEDGGWDEDRARKKVTKANQEAANLRARLKELEPLARKAQEIEEASKSEQVKLAEALEAERNGRSTAEQKLLRYEVGADKGVPSNLMRFLTGNSREEVEEAADALLKELGVGKTASSKTPGRAPERVANGAPSSPDDDLDPLELIEKVRAGRV